MKKISFLILTAAMSLASVISVKAQTADEIISKHLAATGGEANWKKINSVKMIGSVNAGGTEIPITITNIQKKAFRMDMVFNGMNNYQIITNTEGWSYFPAYGQPKPEATPAETLKQAQESLDLMPMVDYKSKGIKVAYLGKDDVEGTECHKLKFTYASGKEETIYIDASNYYHIRSVIKANANGKEVEQTSNFSNFQKLPEGVVFPMSVDEGMGAFAIKTIEVNKPIDESIFKPTEVAAGKDAKK